MIVQVISNVNEKGRTRIEADVTIKTCFKAHLEAFNIVLKLPVPKWTASAVVKVPVGRAIVCTFARGALASQIRLEAPWIRNIKVCA